MAAAKEPRGGAQKGRPRPPAPRGACCWSILALMKRMRRRHSWMLAAEMAAPVASIAASRQPEAFQSTSAASAPTIKVIANGALQQGLQAVVGQTQRRSGFLVSGLMMRGRILPLCRSRCPRRCRRPAFGIFVSAMQRPRGSRRPARRRRRRRFRPSQSTIGAVQRSSHAPMSQPMNAAQGSIERDLHHLLGLNPCAEQAAGSVSAAAACCRRWIRPIRQTSRACWSGFYRMQSVRHPSWLYTTDASYRARNEGAPFAARCRRDEGLSATHETGPPPGLLLCRSQWQEPSSSSGPRPCRC